jgi:DNA-binding SARP family transcriptional activator
MLDTRVRLYALRRLRDHGRVAVFRVLGPVEAIVEDRPAAPAAEKPRALLALLLLNRNRTVRVDALIAGLWGEEPPETASKALQVYVSQLRKAIGPERLLTRSRGYELQVGEGDELDLDAFERLVHEGRELLEGDRAADAAPKLAEALGLWRGAALADLRSEPFAEEAAPRLEEARLAALEDRIDADLALGRHDRLIPELETLVAREPFRERLRGQLMLALYRAGRQAEALDVYRRTREALVDELGIEPGPELQELERAILRQDPELKPGRRRSTRAEPADGAGAARPTRRLLPLVAAGLVVALAAAALALGLTRGSSDGGATSTGAADLGLSAFVTKVENFLGQSRDGRAVVATAIGGVLGCRVTPRVALARLDQVQRNRQSLLEQEAALQVPDRPDALHASDLLQRATQASITADWHYRDWLVSLKRCRSGQKSLDLAAARAADLRATRAKRAFLAAFDPLARQLHQRVWTVDEF